MISIVITAYKEHKTVGKAIEQVIREKIQDRYEILVIAPDKETLEKAKEYSKKYKEIKVIKDEGMGKPAALNLIFKIAKGDILVLTDGDVYIKEGSIKQLINRFDNKKVGAVSGRPISLNSSQDLLGYWSHLLSDVAHKRRLHAVKLGKRFYCSGYLYAIRTGIVKEIPKETLSEDGYISHLIYEAGYKIDYCPKAEVYIKYPTTFKDWLIQKKRSAGGYNQIKIWIGEDIRSFKKESSGVMDVLKYAKNFKEFSYTLALILARIYLWFLIFININIRKKEFKKIWKRVETTK